MTTPSDAQVYFAAERTLLAWIRTGLAMMGFGFVVARFGLFLRELGAVDHALPPEQTGVSLWVGTTLVVLGVAVNVFAVVRHWQILGQLDRGRPLRFRAFSLGAITGLVLALLGAVVAFYLLYGLNGAE